MVEFFTGMFDVMGITIEETGEDLTVRVGEVKVHIDLGLPDKYDLLVTLEIANVKNLVSHAAYGGWTHSRRGESQRSYSLRSRAKPSRTPSSPRAY